MRRAPAALAEVGWAAALLVVGACALASGWSGWLAVVVLVAATVIPYALVLLLGRVVAPWLAGFAVLAALLVGVHVALRGTSGGLSTIVSDALPILLTGPVPALATPVGLAPGVLLVGLGGLATGLRLTATGRHRVTPLVCAGAAYLAGQALTAGRADRFGVLAATLLAITVLGWIRLDGGVRGASRQWAAGITVMVVAVGALAALPTREAAYDPRTRVHTPTTVLAAVSPLSQVTGWNADPATVLYRVRGDEFPLHLVVLSDFTGAGWQAPGRYQPMGTATRAELPPGERRTVVRAEVTMAELQSPWLPAPGLPQQISLDGVGIDPTTGTALYAASGTGLSYRVSGTVDAPTQQMLLAGRLSADPRTARYLTVPDLPNDLATYAQTVTRTATTPLQRALAIESAVRGDRTVSAKAPTGSSYRRITEFLLGERTPGAGTGSSEQFAAAFAILARASGLPTRLVVGFTPGTVSADEPEVREVRGADALAWPEVYFADVGWVPFAPTPATGRTGPDVNDTTTATSPPITPAPKATATAPGNAVLPPVPGAVAPVRAGGLPLWVRWSGLAAAVVMSPLLCLYALRARRRAAHRAGGAVGAWSEMLDVALLAGVPARRSDTAEAVAAVLASVAGSRSATGGPDAASDAPWHTEVVAAAANEAAFAAAPTTRTQVSLWPQVRAIQVAVRAACPWWRRLIWAIDPRVLRRRDEVPIRKVPEPQVSTLPAPRGQDDWAPVGAGDRGQGSS